MMKKTFKLASLTFLMFGCAVASEFRPPLNLERGPQRCDVARAEQDEASPWDLNMWTIGYSRNANKAFVKHGSNTSALSALIFGKENFKVSDALPQNLTTDFSGKFNANLNSTTLYPRVTYDEKGVNLGFSVGYRVFDGKGVVGIKANVPLKTVRMERDNNAETAEQGSGQTNYVFGSASTVTVPVDRPAGVPQATAAANHARIYTAPITVGADFYKVSAVKNFPFLEAGNVVPFIRHNGVAAAGGRVIVGGQTFEGHDPVVIATPANQNLGIIERADIPFVFFYNDNPALVPTLPARAVKLGGTVRGSNNQAAAAATTVDTPLAIVAGIEGVGGGAATVAGANLPETNASVVQGSVIQAGGAVRQAAANVIVQQGPAANASRVVDEEGAAGGAVTDPQLYARLTPFNPAGPFAANTLYSFDRGVSPAQFDAVLGAFEQFKDNFWMMTVATGDGTGKINAGQNDALKERIARYSAESAEQWLFRNGYTMTNNQRTGLGDITINPFYDHSFSADWKASVYLHLCVPTGGSKKTGDNPYKARLGNDNHVELGGGANVAWQALSWMNIRLDAMAAYALPGTERINAPFKGATARGVGPTVDADIDYAKLRASIDTTLVHPKASALSTTFGYDFEYKSKDNVSLKDKKYTFKTKANDKNSWFDGFWVNAVGGGALQDRAVDLDASVQAKNTERISHNVRAESSWQATEQLSLFCGGSSVPFGQYVAKMTSVYGGMNVKF
jgi:hypothetical protein